MTNSTEPDIIAWRRSSYSNGTGGECVEVADGLSDSVPVRDSKYPHGPALLVPADCWTGFVAALKGDHFDG